MMIHARMGIAAALGLLVASGSLISVRAQVPNFGPGQDVASNFLAAAGMQQVQIPQQGTWAEIINVTSRWIVVQNRAGQQFPIGSDHVRQFLVRWPTSIDQLTNNSVIEVTGPDGGSNTIIADHIDIYEADTQGLVNRTVQSIVGNNRTLSGTEAVALNQYGTAFWMTGDEYNLPWRMHVVGHYLGGNPIQVEGVGNNGFAILPSDTGMSMTRVTRGNNSYARRGDFVYMVTNNVTPRSLEVSQLILYKRVPFHMFQP